jgi:tryptophan synthase alpha chain
MGYFNPVLQYGVEGFFRDAKEVGVDGVLLVDLPPEEGAELRRAAKKNGLGLIFLLAPTSQPKRIDLVGRKGSGFIYYVSLTGITGARLSEGLGQQAALKYLRKSSPLPICVGFGIKDPHQAKQVARFGDGVVVGSALVQVLEKHPGRKSLPHLKSLVTRLAHAVHGG